jgi:hypothetical protein
MAIQQMTLSNLENQILEQVRQHGKQMGIPTKNSDETLIQYSFQDFVAKFLQAPVQQAASAGTSLQSLPLQLDLSIEQGILGENLSEKAAKDMQGVTAYTWSGQEGAAHRIEIYTPQTQADGSIQMSVTVIKIALRHEAVGQTPMAQSSEAVGAIPAAEASGKSGYKSMDQFLSENRYAQTLKDKKELMEYSTENAAELVHEEERMEAFHSNQAIDRMIQQAWATFGGTLDGMIAKAAGMSADEKEYFQDILDKHPDEVFKKAFLEFLTRKKNDLEKAYKELEAMFKAQQAMETDLQALAEIEKALEELQTAIAQLKDGGLTEGQLHTLFDNVSDLLKTEETPIEA